MVKAFSGGKKAEAALERSGLMIKWWPEQKWVRASCHIRFITHWFGTEVNSCSMDLESLYQPCVHGGGGGGHSFLLSQQFSSPYTLDGVFGKAISWFVLTSVR